MARVTDETSATRRRRRAVLLGCVLVSAGLLAGVVVLAASSGRETAAGADAGPYRGSEPQGRYLLPGFDLPRYNGGRLVSSELRGRIVLLTVLDAQCKEACPILASMVARSVDRLSEAERAQVRALAVSADPVEDTPAAVRRFLRARRAEGRLEYLLGEERELRLLWTALHVLPSVDSGRDNLHSAPLRIYDRDGAWVATLHAGADLSEDNLLHDIRYALRAGANKSER